MGQIIWLKQINKIEYVKSTNLYLYLIFTLFLSSPVIYWWAAVLTTPKSQKPVPLIDLQKNVKQLGPGKVEKQTNLVSYIKPRQVFYLPPYLRLVGFQITPLLGRNAADSFKLS